MFLYFVFQVIRNFFNKLLTFLYLKYDEKVFPGSFRPYRAHLQ